MEAIIENTTTKQPKTWKIKPVKALAITIVITLITMSFEFIVSAITGSLMLWSDGIHMLSHAASLGVSLIAATIASKPTSRRFPFGLHRVEIVAAHINGIGLGIFTLFIVYESFLQLLDPHEIMSREMMIVAAIGLVVNLLTAFILSKAGLEDLNTKSAFLHLLADTFSSIAILVGGVIMVYTEWFWIDALLSMIIALVIGKWAWGLLRESFLILMDRSPEHINYFALETELKKQFGQVRRIKSFKVWEIKTSSYAGTLHLSVGNLGSAAYFGLQQSISKYLREHYQINEMTIQMDMHDQPNYSTH